MKKLSLNPTILLTPSSEGYLAFDTESDRLHELNPTAALLVELCDGSRTAEEVVQVVAPLLPPDSTAAVLAWLNEAVESGVLAEIADNQSPDQVHELTAPQLIELAGSLRDHGKVQAAFLCQQRAVELDSSDADQLRELGELAHIVGKRAEARAAYEQYLELQPSDAEIRHLLTSLRDEEPPARVPTECIQQLYQRFSSFYEANMCEELSYEGPVHLKEIIDNALGDRHDLAILDLGCGTGLAGKTVADRARRLVGIDLSAEMIALAQKHRLYDELHVAEVTSWLERTREAFDLIMACDTLIYFGDLQQVLVPAAKLLAPGGVLAFSVERATTGRFRLTDNGRYVHHLDHIREAARGANLVVTDLQDAFLRMEYGQPVTGLFVALQAPGSSDSQQELDARALSATSSVRDRS